MNIFMTGGTGFIGSILTKHLLSQGHDITILTRREQRNEAHLPGLQYLIGIPTQEGEWQAEVPKHDVIINLAGDSIFKRWTDSAKLDIRNSRLMTTRNLVKALEGRSGKETHFLSTSAVGYYGFHGDEDIDEESLPGDDFLADLSKEWESIALEAEAFGTRVVLLRFGIVLGRKGGALRLMLPMFKAYLGSPLGKGGQWFSWIHEQDLVRIYAHLLEDKGLRGPINCSTPYPIQNKEMTRILARVLGKPVLMPGVPRFVLKAVMGEFGSMLLEGQKVLPKRLLERGFRFEFPEMKGALEDLLL